MAPTESCRRGVECTDFSNEHRARFSHPVGITLACQYGSKCYRKNLQHLQQFAHPGDRNYRIGMVHFPERKGVKVKPEFTTLRELFNYCDPDESGNISEAEFRDAWDFLRGLPPLTDGEAEAEQRLPDTFAEAWKQAAGEDHTHLTFAQFARFASDANIRLPVGIDLSDGADRACHFQYPGGGRCPCAKFEPGGALNMCSGCQHKSSVHLSDTALMTFEEQEVLNKLRKRAADCGGRGSMKFGALAAPARRPGFTMVTDKETLQDLQRLLSETHKEHDNWTRDRGCSLHGRNACEVSCIMGHRAPVPTGYELMRAERNRNAPLYQTYATTRAAIKQECSSPGAPFTAFAPLSALEVKGEEPLDASINEWRLLHGSNLAALKSICGSNFRLKLAGSGATWKDKGKKAGTPLYGYGVYCAENVTKADEYASPIEDGLPADIGCCAVLVCRAVGGLCRVVDTNEFDTEELRRDVFDGPFHSVLGDRVTKLGKPFREVVLYDSAQVFPEFLLYYRRLGMPDS